MNPARQYLRFVRPGRIKGMAARPGFLTAAFELRDRPDLDRHSAARLRRLLDWFQENLPLPDRFTSSTSKAVCRVDQTRGLSWFKPEAVAAIAMSRDLIALLAEHGYPIESLRSDRIGRILYEDDDQIVAVPFADTPV